MATIRDATPQDEEALLQLEALSPQGRGTRISMDRSTYFYRSDLFDVTRVKVVEEQGQVRAVMAYAVKEVFLGGKPVPVAYLYDMRSHPSYRKTSRRGPMQLWKAIQESAHDDGAHLLYGHVKSDNMDSLRMGGKRGFRTVGEFEITTFPTRRGRHSAVRQEDVGAVVAELEVKNRDRDLLPVRLAEVYARGRELGFLRGVYHLETRGSRAQATVWDSSRVSRGRVVRLPWPLRILGWALNPLAGVLPLPHIPRPGQSLRFWHLCDLRTEGPRGKGLMRRLLGGLSHLGASEGANLVAAFRYRGDPLSVLPPPPIRNTLLYRTVALPLRGEVPQRLLYLDVRDV